MARTRGRSGLDHEPGNADVQRLGDRGNGAIAERAEPADNAAFVNMAATVALHEAVDCAERLGYVVPGAWRSMANGVVLPVDADVILDHDGYTRREEKASTPAPLAGLFPLGYPASDAVKQATLRFYLDMADDYAGSPMLSALLRHVGGNDVGPDTVVSGCSRRGTRSFRRTASTWSTYDPTSSGTASLRTIPGKPGGFLMACMYGLTGLRVSSGDPMTWSERPVVMPGLWDGVEIERLWIRGRPATLRTFMVTTAQPWNSTSRTNSAGPRQHSERRRTTSPSPARTLAQSGLHARLTFSPCRKQHHYSGSQSGSTRPRRGTTSVAQSGEGIRDLPEQVASDDPHERFRSTRYSARPRWRVCALPDHGVQRWCAAGYETGEKPGEYMPTAGGGERYMAVAIDIVRRSGRRDPCFRSADESNGRHQTAYGFLERSSRLLGNDLRFPPSTPAISMTFGINATWFWAPATRSG